MLQTKSESTIESGTRGGTTKQKMKNKAEVIKISGFSDNFGILKHAGKQLLFSICDKYH